MKAIQVGWSFDRTRSIPEEMKGHVTNKSRNKFVQVVPHTAITPLNTPPLYPTTFHSLSKASGYEEFKEITNTFLLFYFCFYFLPSLKFIIYRLQKTFQFQEMKSEPSSSKRSFISYSCIGRLVCSYISIHTCTWTVWLPMNIINIKYTFNHGI